MFLSPRTFMALLCFTAAGVAGHSHAQFDAGPITAALAALKGVNEKIQTVNEGIEEHAGALFDSVDEWQKLQSEAVKMSAAYNTARQLVDARIELRDGYDSLRDTYNDSRDILDLDGKALELAENALKGRRDELLEFSEAHGHMAADDQEIVQVERAISEVRVAQGMQAGMREQLKERGRELGEVRRAVHKDIKDLEGARKIGQTQLAMADIQSQQLEVIASSIATQTDTLNSILTLLNRQAAAEGRAIRESQYQSRLSRSPSAPIKTRTFHEIYTGAEDEDEDESSDE